MLSNSDSIIIESEEVRKVSFYGMIVSPHHGTLASCHHHRYRRLVGELFPLYPLSYHPLWLFDVSAPRLDESRELGTPSDAVVHRPADAHLKPPLTFPISQLDVSHPSRTAECKDCHAAARHQYRHRALAYAVWQPHITHSEGRRESSVGVSACEHAGHLPASEMSEMF
jgi:hypothetical protein